MSVRPLILKRCCILQDGNEVIRDIVITGNTITDISNNVGESPAGQVIDVKRKHLLPGLIDPHVHFREPGMTHKEDFRSGSMAAAAGGITTILDMPNTIPPTISNKLLEEKRIMAQKSLVNYGFHFGTTGDNCEEINKARNIASVKVYMNETTGKLLVNDITLLEKVFAAAKRISVHAEGETMELAIRLALKYKRQLYIVHVSTQYEIELIKKYKHKGNIFAEATPHHLFLSEEDKQTHREKNLLEMKPSLKTKKDRDALFTAVKDGLIDCIGSDHAPHTLQEKASTVYGVPGVETMLPLLLDQVHKGRMSLTEIQHLCSENPAKIFGIKNKGYIRKGYDADLVVVDCMKHKEVGPYYGKSTWSPFAGRKLWGWPVTTIVNGAVVFTNGEFTCQQEKERIPELRGKEVNFVI